MTAPKRARTFAVASMTSVSADSAPDATGTLARPDAGTDARPDARPTPDLAGVLPVDKGANSHRIAMSPVEEYDRKRDARAVTAAALSLSRAYERVAERAAELRTEIDRAGTLRPRDVMAILMVNGLTQDLTPLGDD